MKILFTALTLVSALVISEGVAAQENSNRSVATFTVRVTPEAQAAPSEAAPGRPKIERINGNVFMTLEKQYSGQSFEVAKGNYVVLSFPPSTGAVGFEVSPPGIFKLPEGTIHLPLNTVGLLQADNPGTATITVKGIRPPPASKSNVNFGPNWSGYKVTQGGPFASVTGSWTVPEVFSDGGQASSTWVGIDDSATALIQVGTSQYYSSGLLGSGIGGGASYYAWWEILPASETKLPDGHPVSPGDQITASVSFAGQGTPTPGTSAPFLITISDSTKNWVFTKEVTYAGALSSAEWIVEAPQVCPYYVNCYIAALADYGSVTFDGGDFLNSGSPNFNTGEELGISQWAHIVSMPSDPDADLDGFTVEYGPNKPPPPGPFITITTLPEAYVNIPYHYALFASTGPGSDFLWTSSGLPTWLTLDPNTGALSGTPPAAGAVSFNVQATQLNEVNERTQLQPLTLTIGANAPPPDFSLSVSPVYNVLESGVCTATPTVTVTPLNGFGGNVSLSITGPTTGSSFNPTFTSTTSKLTLDSVPCAPGEPARVYTITGKSGSIVHTTAVVAVPPLKICPPSVPGSKPLPVC